MKQTITRIKTTLAISITTATLVGCGGGGSDTVQSTPTVTTSPTTPVTTPSEPKPTVEKEPAIAQNNTSVATVNVGVLDTGIDAHSATLKDSVVAIDALSYDANGELVAKDLLSADTHTQDSATEMHGTFVSNIIASNGANGSTKGFANGIAKLYGGQVYTATESLDSKAFFDTAVYYNKKDSVHLFNISSSSNFDNFTDEQIVAFATQAAVADNISLGNLLIFATGNDGVSTPSSLALLPKYNAALESGWLAVTGLNEAHTALYREDGEGGNACGDAAKWCLAADYVNTGISNPASGSSLLYLFKGTSGATPQVTAVAAKVMANYPWMSVDQVRQAILTTATYIDDGSQNNGLYNETYGWGYFNAAKAAQGMGKFSSVFGDFDANVGQNQVGVFSNDISGDAGLIKDGEGRLILSGQNSYTGNTTVNTGVLKILGSSATSNFSVNSAGTLLAGNGTVGSVNNNGNVSTEDGTLLVKGDYTQSKDATLTYKVGNDLTVNGKATIDGKLTVTATAAKYVETGTHKLLTANNGLTGTFTNVSTNSAFLALANTHYDGNSVSTDVTLKPAASAASVQGGVSVPAGELTDKLMTKANDLYKSGDTSNSLVDYATKLQSINTAGDVQKVLNSNSGSIYAETTSVLLKNQSIATSMASRHVANVTQSGSGVWADYSALSTKNGANGWDTVDSDLWVATAGADWVLNDNLILGGYASQLNDHSKYSLDNDKAITELTNFGLYAKTEYKNAYALGLVSYGIGHTKFERTVNSGLTSDYSRVKGDASIFNTYAETGYAFTRPLNHMVVALTPYAALSYSKASIDGIQEALATGLSVGDMKANELGLHAGLRLEATTSDGVTLGGFIDYTNFSNRHLSDVSITSNLDRDSTTTYTPPSFDKDFFTYGMNIQYTTPATQWVFFGNAAVVSDTHTGYEGQVGLKYKF